MLDFLNQPSPININFLKRIRLLLILFVSVFLFFIAFQPFGLNNETLVTCVKMSAYYSFAGLIIGVLNLILIPYILPNMFKEASWTLKKNIIWGFWNFFSFASLIFIAHNIYYSFNNFTIQVYLRHLYYILIIGFPLNVIIDILKQNYLLKTHVRIANNLNNSLQSEKQVTPEKVLKFEVDRFKVIEFAIDKLIYVEALGNYINIVFQNNGVRKITIREPIGNIENMVCDYNYIMKTHRSYLLNINYIDKVTGDSQGLKVLLKDTDNIIPVSRSKIMEFRQRLVANN